MHFTAVLATLFTAGRQLTRNFALVAVKDFQGCESFGALLRQTRCSFAQQLVRPRAAHNCIINENDRPNKLRRPVQITPARLISDRNKGKPTRVSRKRLSIVVGTNTHRCSLFSYNTRIFRGYYKYQTHLRIYRLNIIRNYKHKKLEIRII